MEFKASFSDVVMQPTSFCNLNCAYCYLPERDRNNRMNVEVAESVACALKTGINNARVTWHGGEPLSCGLSHFQALIEPFFGVQHAIQTNGTLIDNEWCRFFTNHQIHVGVSIDGPSLLNGRRVDWNNRPSFPRIMRGIELLKTFGIEFSTICVIDPRSLPDPAPLYAFFCSIGCSSVGFNIEEQVGTHFVQIESSAGIKGFWAKLFKIWQQNPVLNIREFSKCLSWMNRVCENQGEKN